MALKLLTTVFVKYDENCTNLGKEVIKIRFLNTKIQAIITNIYIEGQ